MFDTTLQPLKSSLFLRLMFVGFLILLLLIPLAMISNLIFEREARRQSVVEEVSATWGGPQTLIGPLLTIPYHTVWRDEKGKTYTEVHKAQFLPSTFTVKGDIIPEIRWRSIFEVVLYRVNLHVSGTFLPPDFSLWKIPPENIIWEEAILSLGIPDTRGIHDVLFLTWNGQPIEFLAGAGNNDLFEAGLHARLPNHLATPNTTAHSFSFEVNLNGNDQLLFAPVGKKTTVNLNSKWSDPSFIGGFLPTQRDISPEGFKAMWEISHLGRSYPQSWINKEKNQVNFHSNTFGVRLLLPVDFYQKSERSIKYGALFILLTFMTFFLFEIFNPLRIHAIQYLMVGFALCLFYLLLLSISEHLGFVSAYIMATVATIVLITGYGSKVLRSKGHAGIMGVVLTGLYAYLYVLLHLQDYALLFGSVGLFVILAIVMFITRNVDWYAVSINSELLAKKPMSSNGDEKGI